MFDIGYSAVVALIMPAVLGFVIGSMVPLRNGMNYRALVAAPIISCVIVTLFVVWVHLYYNWSTNEPNPPLLAIAGTAVWLAPFVFAFTSIQAVAACAFAQWLNAALGLIGLVVWRQRTR